MEDSATTTGSAIESGQQSEYSQSFGTQPGMENRVTQPRVIWKRNDSQIMPPFHTDEVERPNKCQQTWPWKDRAHHSDIFEPVHDKDNFHAKNTKKWPWQDRAAVSHVFDGNNNGGGKTEENLDQTDGLHEDSSRGKSGRQQWPWQSRARTSDIFGDADAPKLRKHKEYSWHQGKSTHNHKADGNFDGVTQYMKDFNQNDSMQKYLGPRHGYKYILKRRDTNPNGGGEDSDFVSEITKMSLDDAALYMKEAEKKLEENPEQYA